MTYYGRSIYESEGWTAVHQPHVMMERLGAVKVEYKPNWIDIDWQSRYSYWEAPKLTKAGNIIIEAGPIKYDRCEYVNPILCESKSKTINWERKTGYPLPLQSDEQKRKLAVLLNHNREQNNELIKTFHIEPSMSVGRYNPLTKDN